MAENIVDNKTYELSITSEGNTSHDLENQITFGNISRIDTSTFPVEEVIHVYGNDLKVKKPCKMGNCYTFWFLHGRPTIVVGPQCNPSLT
jgi:hypothetical protein